MRARSRLVCRIWTQDYGRRACSDRRSERLRFLPAAWTYPSHHAVELPDMAADTHGHPYHAGRQCCAREALDEHTAEFARIRAREAGRVIKKTVMELGGSDAFIVLEDADIPAAVAAGIKGRFLNAGQVCLAAKRFILVEKIADEFERRFVEATRSIRVGDPFDPTINMGPMARADLRDSLHKQVEGSVAKGARVLCGGEPTGGKGAFYKPTVMSGVKQGMPAFDEETFGPVAAITRVADLDAAVNAANASEFGLSGNLWTKDIDLARKVARDLYTGGVFINGITATDPRVPVGGVKNSGYGRELSHFGAHAFVNAQTVWIENH